jgi:hypothetical protein
LGGGVEEFRIFDYSPDPALDAAQGRITDGAVQLDGTDQRLMAADHGDFDTGAGGLTVGGWARRDAIDVYHTIISKYTSTGSQREFILRFRNTNVLMALVSANGSALTEINHNTFGVTSADKWYFCVVRYDPSDSGNELKLAIGTEDGPALSHETPVAHAGGVRDDISPVRIGAMSGDQLPFDGRLDSMFYYTRCLTDAELDGLYNITDPGVSAEGRCYSDLAALLPTYPNILTDLAAWWDLNEAGGGSWMDSHTGGHDLTEEGVAAFAPAVGVKAGVADDEDTVSQWANLGNRSDDYIQGTAAARPTVEDGGTYPSLVFDGSDDYLDMNELGTTNGTYAWVCKVGGYASELATGSSGEEITFTDATTLTVTDHAANTSTFTLPASASNWHVYIWQAGKLWQDGAACSLAGDSPGSFNEWTKLGGNANPFNGELSQFYYAPQPDLTVPQLNGLTNWLGEIHGLPQTEIT